MRKILCLILLLLPLSMQGGGNSHKSCPDWVKGYNQELPNSYISVVNAIGDNEEDARKKAWVKIEESRSYATGHRFSITSKNGEVTSTSGHDDLTIKCKVLDEYYEKLPSGEYKAHLLVQTAKHPDDALDPVNVKYKISPWVLLPGAAQWRNGYKATGSLIITGEILAVGGIIASECTRSHYKSLRQSTHDPYLVKKYESKASTFRKVSYGCIGAAAGIYLFNIIHGCVVGKECHIETGYYSSWSFAPFTDTNAAGISLSLKF